MERRGLAVRSGRAQAGDVMIALSGSGRSSKVLREVRTARVRGAVTCALTGEGPNPLSELADDAVCLAGPTPATVEELQLVALNIVCGAVDRELALRSRAASRQRVLV
jgi:DNA-binding MurR/RpiR family transcriptional regulator